MRYTIVDGQNRYLGYFGIATAIKSGTRLKLTFAGGTTGEGFAYHPLSSIAKNAVQDLFDNPRIVRRIDCVVTAVNGHRIKE